MSFFEDSLELKNMGDRLITQVCDRFPISPDQVAVTCLVYGLPSIVDIVAQTPDFGSRKPLGYSHRGGELTFPASVVKLFYLVAFHEWLERGMIQTSSEAERALRDMVVDSGNDATGLIVDLLSGTTGGPELPEEPFHTWKLQRQIVNRYYHNLNLPEYSHINVCQKVWCEGPYGRERAFYGAEMGNRNLLTTEATAHLLQNVMAGIAVNRDRSAVMRSLLQRSLKPQDLAADPENQVTGFLGEGLPQQAKLWSKAGLMSKVRHDAAYVEIPGKSAFTLVVFTEALPQRQDILPWMAEAIAQNLNNI
jgi:hypothetical protein